MSIEIIYGASRDEWKAAAALFGDAILPSICSPEAAGTPNEGIGNIYKQPSNFTKEGTAHRIKGWQKHIATPKMVEAWSSDNRLGICASTRNIQAIDIDCATPELTDFAINYFADMLDEEPPLRIGKTGRGTILVRIESLEPIAKSKFIVRNDGGAIELLATGQQTMLCGMHESGTPYFWPDGLPRTVPTATLEYFNQIWNALSAQMGDGTQLNLDGVNERSIGSALSAIDPFAQTLRDAGIVRSENPTMMHLTCPWAREHSGLGGLTDSAYMFATTTQPANYRCLHTHCEHRNISTLKALFGFIEDDFSDVALIDPEEAEDLSIYDDPRWVKKTNKDGNLTIEPRNKNNIQVALSHPALCGGLAIRYDSFSGSTTVWDMKGTSGYMPMLYSHVTHITNSLCDNPRLKLRVSDKELSAQISLYQKENGVDCAKNALSNLPDWDGELRLRDYARDVLLAGDSSYVSNVGIYIFVAIVSRIWLENVSVEAVPVLIGRQKAGKSRVVEGLALLPEYFSKMNLSMPDADKYRQMAGRSVINLDELAGLSRSDVGAIKSFITETKDTWTPKFGNRAITQARRCLMIGTTNESDFLLDPTGNRRFFPMQIGLTGSLNLALQVENKLQYYAEALHMIKQNNSIVHEIYNHIDESSGAEEARLQATRLSPKHKKIKDWLCRQDSSAMVSLIDMYEAVVGTNSIRAIELIELGQSMVRLGYECVDKVDKIYKIKYESLE